MVPGFTAAENVSLGVPYPRVGPIIRKRAVLAKARPAAQTLGLELSALGRRVADLSVADQQLVAVCRALTLDQRLLILDEPTAALTGREVDRLFEVVRVLIDKGCAIAYISHRLEEIERIAHRVTVMRDGQRVATVPATTERRRLVELMTGKELPAHVGALPEPKVKQTETDYLLRAEGIDLGGRAPISLTLHPGEILGLAGLVGSGRTRLGRSLCGLERIRQGRVLVDEHPIKPGNVRKALAAGIAFAPEDRKREGLVMNQSVGFNVGLANFSSFASCGLIAPRRRDRNIRDCLALLDTRFVSLTQPVAQLSGGNQQKVLLARWILKGSRVIVLDEPTAGLDVSAQADVYETIRGLAANGAAVLYISSDFDDLLNVADRALVMRDHSVAAELWGDELDKSALLKHSFGLQDSDSRRESA